MEKKVKISRRFPLAIQAILMLIASCSGVGRLENTGSSTPSKENTTLNQASITASTGNTLATSTIPVTSQSTPIPQSGDIRTSYIISASLKYATHSLAVDEIIYYKNSTGDTLPELALAVEPNLWAGCFVLGGLLINGQYGEKPVLHDDRLEIPLSHPLAQGDSITVSIQYDLVLPPADIHHVFGFNARQINLVDWYPFIVPYSKGWILHAPANVGEHLTYDTADFDVTVKLVDQDMPMILAASAPSEMISGSWHYKLFNSRTFVISASPSYKTISSTVSGVTVTSYYFDKNETPARVVLDATNKAMNIFSELFGGYLHSSLSIVETPFFDGMEYDGLFFLSQDFYASYNETPLNNLVDIAVHETAHQWWFGQVGNDQAMEPWLDEALSTYSEEIFFEKNLADISDWWTFRVESFSPTGWVDTDIYDGINFRTYANAVYLRGAEFLAALRKKMGDVAFFTFLKDYAAQMSGKISSGKDFFRILRTHTNADISDLISEYFRHLY